MNPNKTFDRALLLLSVVLATYFLIRWLDFSKLSHIFPLHLTGDIPSYMTQLHFLSQYGFHQVVPNWFNGLVLFLRYPPGWAYFTLPVYKLTGNLTLSTLISVTVTFASIFSALYIFGKKEGLSKERRIAFFLFMFANAIAIGNFLRLGRAPELLGWLWFIITTSILIRYKDQKIDLNFLWIIPAYAALILTHPTLGVYFHLLFLFPTLFIIKKNWKERTIIFLSALSGLMLSSFWLVPFILDNLKNKVLSNLHFGQRMLGLQDQPMANFVLNNLAATSVVILLWASFYIYWKHKNKSKRELVFFSPVLILSVLFLLRITFVLPLANIVYPDIYSIGFLFFSFYFLFKTSLKRNATYLFIIVLSLFAVSNIGVSIMHTPWFPEYTSVEQDTLSLLPFIDGRFLMATSPYKTSYPFAYYSYAAVYYDLSTPHGMGTEGLFPSYQKPIQKLNKAVSEKDCLTIAQSSKDMRFTNLIAYDKECDYLRQCGFKEIKASGPACLYKIEQQTCTK